MRILFAAIAALSVGGCMPAGPDATQVAQQDRMKDGFKACSEKYAFGMARSKCLNDVMETARPTYPFPDILDVVETGRIAIAEKFERREITEAEARARLAKLFSEEDADYRRRLGQQASLDMQRDALFLSTRPITCTSSGAFTNCF